MQLTLGTAIAKTLAAYIVFAGHCTAANGGWASYLSAHPISTRTLASIVPAQSLSIESVQIDVKKPSATSNTARVRCPANCNDSKPNNWTVYHDVDRLALCNRTMLLDFALYNPLHNHKTHASIRSCTANFDSSFSAPGRLTNGSCRHKKNLVQAEASLQMAWLGSSNNTETGDVVAAAQQMERYITKSVVGCKNTIAFAYSGQAALGLYAGSGIQSQGIATTLLQQFGAHVQANGVSESLLVQHCATNGRSSKFAFGIAVSANANLSFIQHAVKTWRDGKCITEYNKATSWQNITFLTPGPPSRTNSTMTQVSHGLHPRATCSTVMVYVGDSCASLAAECGITPAQFTVYNPSSTLCSTLSEGQHVCCSSGTLPDFTPKPNPDGTCHSYLVQGGDFCDKIARANSLTVAQLENFNLKTWGWMGCADLQAGNNICLSSGSPPMPAPLVNAVCGPQAPGTPTPPAGIDLSTLNGCVLNACCDIWGQCGTTDEFCTASKGPAGAPGTAAVGSNGCISNCGTQVVMGLPPAVFRKIGYFEAFDSSRPCLNKPITSFDTTGYTHIHLAFATISLDWDVDVTAIEDQFLSFVQMTGFKKILSFGGWVFSTDPSTYFIFRQAMEEPNRDTFVTNVVAFVKKYNLDGVDFDWEYPSEPDIEGIPPGTALEGLNYFIFLNNLRNSLPAGTSLSIAAPAGFWYLKGFPIQAISMVVDYIIFMTYDLHGQWDYGHPYSDAGCPGGNCLQSHVNLTETINALSMVTKAGVPSNKVVVGVTSYGRSFQMTTPGCTTPECTYTGPLSGAYLGPCTNTSGYIGNAEIADIIAGTAVLTAVDGSKIGVTGNVQSYRDDSFSDIVVYDDTQWIAYMADDNKATRTQVYAALNLGGTTDWAVDLQSFEGDTGWPQATNGQCKGSDCVDGHCVGTACISLGCDGPGCINGLCTTPNCTPKACAGTNCMNGVCSGPGCKTLGCDGPDCGANGKCTDSHCVSLGCSGEDCDPATGICSGIDCGKSACGGRSCQNGVCQGGSAACEGWGMQPWPTFTSGECKGLDCVGGVCIGIRCISFGCSSAGSGCSNGICTDGSCTITACIGPGCVNGVCVKPGCKTTGCIGKDCNAAGACTGPECVGISCAGGDCDAATGLCFGPECVKESCAGSDCDQGNCEGGNQCVPMAGCTGSDCGGTATVITTTGSDGKSTTYVATLGPIDTGGGTVTTVTTTGSNGQSTTFTEILVPTTATDSAGHIVTGTITKGPTTTSTDSPVLITYTTFPPGVSASSTSVTHNTHDAQGHPVLGPWPGCWFCPPGSFGWKLFGIGPGVFPHGGPPAGFPNPFPRITIKPNGDPEYDSSSSSECKIATVTDVTSWVEVTVDGTITSTAISAYSTASSITKACSATAHTTTKYSTTGERFCEPTSCGSACALARKRKVVPSDAPKLDNLPEDRFDASNLTIFERNLPEPGDQGDWGTWYNSLIEESGTVLLNNDKETLNTNTAVEVLVWGNTKQAIVVQQLTGCIALLCVSHIGAFVAHFWENQSIKPGGGAFEDDVIYILDSYLGSILNPIQLGLNPACYIMGGTRGSINGNSATDKVTLTRSDPAGPKYPMEMKRITDTIYELIPGAFVDSFTYTKQLDTDAIELGYGKGAVLFDPSQTTPPNGDNQHPFPPGYASVAVYLQGYKAIKEYFPLLEFQIWRANVPGNPSTSELTRSVNLVRQVARDTILNPCSDLVSVASSEWVPLGSTITDIGFEGTLGDGGQRWPFSLKDSSGSLFLEDCTFKGSAYAPIADPVSGFNAGVISCKDNIDIQCTRPYDNQANTCGGVQAAQCGTLGIGCSTFYQLIATCII